MLASAAGVSGRDHRLRLVRSPWASLPLDQALNPHYPRYRQEPVSGPFGRFICPAPPPEGGCAFGAADRSPCDPLEGRGARAGGGGRFVSSCSTSSWILRTSSDKTQNLVVSHGYEVKAAGHARGFQRVHGIGSRPDSEPVALPASSEPVKLTPFFECPWSEALRWDYFAESLQLLAVIGGFGWKLRCGGVQIAAFPTSAQVARVAS